MTMSERASERCEACRDLSLMSGVHVPLVGWPAGYMYTTHSSTIVVVVVASWHWSVSGCMSHAVIMTVLCAGADHLHGHSVSRTTSSLDYCRPLWLTVAAIDLATAWWCVLAASTVRWSGRGGTCRHCVRQVLSMTTDHPMFSCNTAMVVFFSAEPRWLYNVCCFCSLNFHGARHCIVPTRRRSRYLPVVMFPPQLFSHCIVYCTHVLSCPGCGM